MTGGKLPYGPRLDRDGGDLSFMTMMHTLDDDGLRLHSSRFDEEILAACIRFALEGDDDVYILKSILREVADALDHPSAKQKLRIVRPRAGRSRTAGERDEASGKQTEIVSDVWRGVIDFGKLEAAIAAAREKHKVGRTTVFRALADEAKIYRQASSLMGGDKLPHKARERWSAEEQAAYLKFANWLDRFHAIPAP